MLKYTPRRKNGNVTKETLIQIAESGAKRPRSDAEDQTERRLGCLFSAFLTKSKACYDPVFKEYIEEIRPDWFQGGKVEAHKQRILELAKKNPLSRRIQVLTKSDSMFLNSILDPRSSLYDAKYVKEIAKYCYWWLNNKDRDTYAIIDMERFFLEHKRFPCILKTAYKYGSDLEKREGFLYYWWRSYKLRRESKSAFRRVKRMLVQTCLPENLFELDLRYFNIAISRLPEVVDFKREKGRLPRGRYFHWKGEDRKEVDRERGLSVWLRSRNRQVTKIKAWNKVAAPLMASLGLPTNLFEMYR